MISDKFTQTYGVLVANTLVSPKDGRVRLFNPQDESVKLYRHTGAVVLHEGDAKGDAEDTSGLDGSSGSGNASASVPLPEHLQCLLDESKENLSASERQRVASLITEFKDVFASSKDDLGGTVIVKHKINVGETAPIRQPARRLPACHREDTEKKIKTMLEQGLITPHIVHGFRLLF